MKMPLTDSGRVLKDLNSRVGTRLTLAAWRRFLYNVGASCHYDYRCSPLFGSFLILDLG